MLILTSFTFNHLCLTHGSQAVAAAVLHVVLQGAAESARHREGGVAGAPLSERLLDRTTDL